MLKKLGSHPDNVYPARNSEEAWNFSMNRVVCPKCGKRGGHENEGHASLYRKTKTGKLEFFDVHCVKCGKCGKLIPVFHKAYGNWSKALEHSKSIDKESEPDGCCYFLTGSGLPPHIWLQEYIYKKGKSDSSVQDKKSDISGPVLIHSLKLDKESDSKEENGCGHVQYYVIGPTLETILREIPKISKLSFAIHQEGKCVVCGKPLRNIFVCFDEEMDKTKLKFLVRNYPCSVLRLQPGSFKQRISLFKLDEISLAETRVVYLSGSIK